MAQWKRIKMQTEIDEAVVSEMTTIVRKDGPVNLDMERLKGPSSTWTYLLDENQFGWGIEMVKAKNAGFLYTAWNAPHFLGSLFILTLLLSRRRKRNHEVKTALEQRGES
jgi:preprotein translocase subunit SecA